MSSREPLSRARVLQAAVALADEHGLDALSMRRLARELGVEAMSLYNHVASKDEILDGMYDSVVEEIELPDGVTDWKAAVRAVATAERDVLLRHPWAVGLSTSRQGSGPAKLRHSDRLLRILREG